MPSLPTPHPRQLGRTVASFALSGVATVLSAAATVTRKAAEVVRRPPRPAKRPASDQPTRRPREAPRPGRAAEQPPSPRTAPEPAPEEVSGEDAPAHVTRPESHIAELADRSAGDVIDAVSRMSTDELRLLLEHEQRHRNRKTVLAAIERAAAGHAAS